MKRGAGAIPDFTVEMVVALVGFLILLAVGGVVYVQLQDSSSDDACALSVLARGTAPQSAQALVPLKCQTQKTCFCATCDARSCQASFAGEKNVRMVKLPADETSAKTIIERETAEAYYRCWKKMGQGKINLFGGYLKSRGLTVGDSTCVICDRLAIDKDVSPDLLDRLNIQGYMRDMQVPEHQETYLELFTNGQVKSYPSVSMNSFRTKDARVASGFDPYAEPQGADRQISIVFMQIQSTDVSSALTQLGTDGLIVAGGTFFTPPGRVGTRIVGALPQRLLTRLGFVTVVGALGVTGLASANAYSGQIVAGGYCGSFSGAAEGNKGCSIFEIMPYKVSWLNNLCSEIEGEP